MLIEKKNFFIISKKKTKFFITLQSDKKFMISGY